MISPASRWKLGLFVVVGSLVGAFGLWGWSAAAAGRTGTGAVAMALLLTTLFKTAVASLFGEPLLMAGVLGVVAGGGLLALIVRFAGDDD